MMMNDLDNFVWLEPTKASTAALVIEHLLQWCTLLVVSDIWVSDSASRFKNRVMQALEKALNVER